MRPLNGRENKPIRAALDANVLISAFLFRRRLIVIELLIKEGKIVPCFTDKTFAELRRVFDYQKFQMVFAGLDVPANDLLETIADKSVIAPTPFFVPNIIKEDLPDNHLLACALAADADFVVSGDKHLLALKEFQGIPIVAPRQFLAQL